MTDTAQNPWQNILNDLQVSLDDHCYKNWFSQTSFDSLEDDIIRVRVPSGFFADWLKEHYQDAVLEITRTLYPQVNHVEYVPEPAEQEKPVLPAPMPARTSPAAPAGKSRLKKHFPKNGFNPKYTFERFVIGAGNRFAHAAAHAVLQAPGRAYNPLFLYGGTGLGKTHLMQAVGQGALNIDPSLRVVFISSEEFTNEMIQSIADKETQRFRAKYRRVDMLLIDDIHFISGKEATQEEFFHTFNTLFDAHKQIVISSDRPPKELKKMEERLVSRFEWGLVTDIQAPDLETRIAILQNKAKLENLNVPPEILRYIATYITNNIRELEGALITLFGYCSLTGSKISLEMAENVLREQIGQGRINPITMEQVQRVVADHFDVRLADLRGQSRQRQVVIPRQIAMYLCKTQIPSISLKDIGEQFGGKDHTTVLHACDKIHREIDRNPTIRQTVDQLTKALRS